MSTHAPSRGTAVTRVAPVPWADLAGVRIGVVLWGGLALLDLARVAAAPAYVGLAAVAVLVTVSAVGTRLRTAALAAFVGWLLVDGFDEHRYGQLGFRPEHDTAVLALLAGLALIATRARR